MPVFDAIFTASSGQSFSFGYKAGVLYSIDPIGDLPVELETSQGYQQVGATVESRSISGVTRTITGRILRNTAYLKRQLRDIFTPYWRSVSETSVSLFYTQPAFRLPVCYSTHQFGLRIQSDFLKLSNPGPDTQDFVLTLTAHGVVRNPGVRDLATGEYLRFLTEMQDGDVIRLWREDGRLRIEQIIDGETFNAFELLDESSTLWTLRHGTRAWTRTADSGMTALYLTLSFSAAYASLVVEENS